MVFGKELETQEVSGRLLHVWVGFRSRQGFPGRDRGPLCRDMAHRLDVVVRSWHCFSMSRQCFTSLS